MQRRSIITVALIPLVGVVLLPVLVDIATDQLPPSLDGYLWLAWPLAAILATIVIGIEVRRAKRPPSQVDTQRLRPAADDLAEAVRIQWRAEAVRRSLYQPAPIQLGWERVVGEVSASGSAILADRAGSSDACRLPSSGVLDDVAKTLLLLPNQQLVALGPPGAGKSTLAVVLTLDLLARRHPGHPVPVPLTLASWDPRTEHLDNWLARRLVEEYRALAGAEQYGPGTALSLVTNGQVLPVLDGLDEIPPPWQPDAVAALNDAVAGGRPLVLTCRTKEYRAAVRTSGVVLANAFVLELGPVRPQAAVTYLAGTGPADDQRWGPVFAHLMDQPAGELAGALSTPLMLWLARVVYQPLATDPVELLDPDRFGDRRAIEDRLLDAFVPTAYAPRPAAPALAPRREYPPEQARDWLTFLARHLHRQGSRELAWWELHRAVSRLPLTGSGWCGFTRIYLAVQGRLPWRLLDFLQDAQRRGVLREVGGVYQFRHARLQDWLAGPRQARVRRAATPVVSARSHRP